MQNFRFVFQYVASDWLFIKDLIFNIDGKIYEYRRLDFNTDCGGEQIWEWCDLQLSDVNLIRALEKAKSIKIKMNGDKYYNVRMLKQVQFRLFKIRSSIIRHLVVCFIRV